MKTALYAVIGAAIAAMIIGAAVWAVIAFVTLEANPLEWSRAWRMTLIIATAWAVIAGVKEMVNDPR